MLVEEGFGPFTMEMGCVTFENSTIKTFEEPRVLDTPQATGRACTVLEQQFDGLIGSHGNKAKAIPARDLRKSSS